MLGRCKDVLRTHRIGRPSTTSVVLHLAGTADLGGCPQHSTPLIDAASMPIVTKLAPSPPCDGCHAPRGAAKSSNRARSFCTLAPSSAPGPHPSCVHHRQVAVGAQATLSPSPSLARSAAAMRWHPHDTRFGRCSVSAAREVASSRYTFSSAAESEGDVLALCAGGRPSAARDGTGFADRRGTRPSAAAGMSHR